MHETAPRALRVSRKEARQKIEAQIEKGEQLHGRQISSHDGLHKARMDANKWSTYNRNLLMRLFESVAPINEYTGFNYQRFSDYMYSGQIPSLQDEVLEYQTNMADSIYSLQGIHERLELYDEPSEMLQRTSGKEGVSDAPQSTFGNDVFIVHGHDQAAKHAIAGFVRRLGLNPIILDEQANRGQTIIEKFEENADNAGFAIVLLTPDDVGALKNKQDELKPRARQNVVLELGYFMGKLGRERVCPLFKDEIERPSDIDGLVYVPMDSSNGWQLQLAKEMKQAGLPVDLNRLA